MLAQGFRDLYVVDNAIFRLCDVYKGQDPRVVRVSPLNVFYGASYDTTFLSDANWIVERRLMTAEDIITEFGHEMTPEEILSLEDKGAPFGPGYVGLYDFDLNSDDQLNGILEDCGPIELYSGEGPNARVYEVCYCSWLEPREVKFALYENKHDASMPIIKVVSDDDRIRPSAKIESRYILDRYEGVRINGSIYVSCGLANMQLRKHPFYGNATQPYAGFCYNGVDNRPYSRVQAVEAVATLYQLVYFQMETLMVLSGVRGFILDIAQLPKDWTLEKFLYYARQGVAPVDSTMPNVKNARGTGFNQFTQYDQTFGNSIQQLQALLGSFEHLAGRIIGIPPQRLGEVVQGDQVGTHQQAIAQSNLTTKVLFNKQNRVTNDVLNMLIRAMPYCWSEGKQGQFVLGDKGQKMINIAKGAFESASFECFLQDSGKDRELMDQAISMITQNFQNTGMPLSQLVSMFGADSLREVKSLLHEYEALAQKKATEGAQFQQQHEKELLDLEARAQSMVRQVSSQADLANAEVNKIAQEVEMEKAKMEMQTKLQVAGANNQTAKYKADQETAMESAVLAEQKRTSDMDARLRMVELALEAQAKGDRSVSSPTPKEKPQ